MARMVQLEMRLNLEEGDCEIFNSKYISQLKLPCRLSILVGNGRCEGGTYNSAGYLFDEGDWTSFNDIYPARLADKPFRIYRRHLL